MLERWTTRDFIKFILLPVVVAEVAFGLLLWAAPPHPSGDRMIIMYMVAVLVCGPIAGIAVRRASRLPRKEANERLYSIPRLYWAIFGGAHGVILGLLLAVPLKQVSPLLLVVGFGGAFAAVGALVALRKPAGSTAGRENR